MRVHPNRIVAVASAAACSGASLAASAPVAADTTTANAGAESTAVFSTKFKRHQYGVCEMRNKFKAFRRALIATAIATTGAAPVLALEAPLVADTYVSNANSTLNFGNLPNLSVGPGNSSLLKFDLSTLRSGIDASKIAKATLIIFVNRVASPGQIEVQPVYSAWSESSVNATNQPVLGGLGSGVTFQVATAQQPITIDITAQIKAWLNNPTSNFGVALVPSAATPNAAAFFDSKENTATSRVARLDIELSEGGLPRIGTASSCVDLNIATRSWTMCPSNMVMVGILESGLATGSKNWFGSVRCCPFQ